VSRDPVPLGDSLNSVIRSLRNDTSDAVSSSQMGDLFGRWAEAVGEAVAAHVRPIKLDATKLVVEVDDPAWATQLRFLETTLKQRLLEVAGTTIETIEARVRRF
jgi:predicted nucleic acid-binding Zn ribbon protein